MMANPHTLIEGVIITSLRDPLPTTRSSTSAARSLHVVPPPAARRRGGLRRRLPRQEHPRLRLRPRHHRARRRRRLHLRRGDRAARLARGPPRPAAAAAAVPRRRRPLRPPDGGQQRRVDRHRCPRIIAQRRRLVHRRWAPRSPRASASSPCPATSRTPGQYEAPLGITLRELLDLAGGIREGHELKFWTPGGSSTPLLTAEHLDVPLDFESVGAAGSMLGTRALQIFDETTCVVRAVAALDRVLQARVLRQVHAVPRGHLVAGADPGRARARRRAREADLDKLLDLCDNILGRSFCALGDGATSPITQLDPVLPRRVPRAPHARRLPVRPDGVDAVRQGRQGQRARMTTTPATTTPAAPRRGRPGHADHRRRRGDGRPRARW